MCGKVEFVVMWNAGLWHKRLSLHGGYDSCHEEINNVAVGG